MRPKHGQSYKDYSGAKFTKSNPSHRRILPLMTLRNKISVVFGLCLISLQVSAQIQSSTICESRKQTEASMVWALDISFSLDALEYETQIQGYITALQDKAVRNNFKYCQCSEISVVTWADRSAINYDFKQMKSDKEIDDLIAKLVALKNNFSLDPEVGAQTNVLDALKFSNNLVMARKEENKKTRLLVTLSGDGTQGQIYPEIIEAFKNEKMAAEQSGVTVNGVPINVYPESDFAPVRNLGLSPIATQNVNVLPADYVTQFYKDHVVTRDGYVETATDFNDFARAIKQSILRDSCQLMM